MFGSGGTGFGGFGQQNNNQQQQGQQGGGLFGTPQQQQPQQGAATGGFGGFGAQPSTFGASNNTGGGLFGQQAQQQQPASSGFTFGQSNTSTPFGQTPQQNQARPTGFGGFGAATSTPAQPSTGFGGFGSTANTQTPAFGATPANNNAFGAKPAGSGGLFGQPAQSSTGAFGQPQSGGLFGGAGAGLGASQTGGMPTQGTSNPPYQPFVNAERDATGGGSTNYQYASISCLPAYRAASLEELRLQDYQQGRKTGNAGPGATGGFGQPQTALGGGGFGSTQPATGGGLFGQQQSQPQQTGFGASTGGGLFGQQNNQQQQQQGGGLFGSTNTNTGGGLFGQQQNQPQQSGGLFGQNNNTQQQGGSSFTFGQPQQPAASSGFTFGQNNQQNKPAGTGAFGAPSTGGFGGNTGSGFTFGANNNQQQQQPAQTGGFGATSTGGFGFGAQAQSNQPKPGGLFGGTSGAPSFGGFGAPATSQPDASKPGFSFGGGFGAGASGAPGQASTTAPTGGLFGGASQQPTTTSQPAGGFSLGGAGTTAQPATSTSSGFSFGAPQGQSSTGGFGTGGTGGLFGQQNKPATGGLFGQPQNNQQQPGQAPGASTGFSFGGAGNTASNTGSSLFGNTASKPGGLFGSSGGAFGGASQPAAPGGGLFGTSAASASQPGGGLFGSTQPGQTSSLFGNNQQNSAAQGGSTLGRGLFGSTTGATGGSLFGQSNTGQSSLFGGQAQAQQAPNLQTSLTSNPYGTDSLFGGQAAASAPGSTLGANTGALSPQPHLPFNVARPSAKKQAPIVPPFRPSPRGPASARVAKLRGSTPSAFREGSPAREGSPSLFASSPSANRLSSPGAGGSLFRGLSDDIGRQQREASTPASLPPQAFYNRSSVKRLVLDDATNRSSPAANRSASIFGSRASSTIRDESPAPGSASAVRSTAPLFDRGATPGSARISFSPALETASSGARLGGIRSSTADETVGDDTFAGNLLGGRRSLRSINESPSKADGIADMSLPALGAKPVASSPPKTNKEDALLPLGYYTSPPLSELRDWSHAELRSVEGFKVGRKGYGSVEFIEPVDLTTVGELSNIPGGIVQLRKKECFVYPDEEDCFDADTGKERDGVQPGFDPQRVPGGKAKQGQGLNVPAIVKLEGCWPLDRSTREPITDGEHVRVKQLINKLKRRSDLTFKDYEPVSGTWSFRVEHFSRYGLDDDDDDDQDDGNAEGQDFRKEGAGKGAQTSSKNDKTKSAQKQSDEDADMAAPPSRALNDDDEEIDMHESNLGPASSKRPASRAASVLDVSMSAPRASTPSVARQTRHQSENPGTQPWAASLGLEPKRIHVMQASFFGGSDGAKQQQHDGGKMRIAPSSAKKGRAGSALSETSLPASRSSFGKALAPAAPSPPKKNLEKTGSAKEPEAADTSLLPPTLARPHKISRIELHGSVVDNAHGAVLDAGLAMSHSFRVGWGPDGSFAHRSKTMGVTDKSATVDASAPASIAQISKFSIYEVADETIELAKITGLLKTELAHATVEIDDGGCPVVYPSDDLRFKDFAASLEGNKDSHYELAIFKLASALFDEIDLKLPATQDGLVDRAVRDELIQTRRKNNVANWIRWYAGETVRSEIRAQLASPSKTSGEHIVFTYLTGGFLEEACKHAIEIGDVRLATLIAQAEGGGSDDEFRLDLLDQLSIWRAGGGDAFISPDYRRVIELLSGNVLLSKGNEKRDAVDRVDDVAIAGGLDWVRAFSLFLHYDQRFEAGLQDSVAAYEASIGMGEGDSVVAPPLPPYLESNVKPGSKRFRDLLKSGTYSRDVCFGLLKLYSQPSDFAIENVAEPLSYGPQKCSYGLAFFLIQLFTKVLRIRDFSDRVELGIDAGVLAQEQLVRGNSARSDNLCTSFAMQLELLGEWTWAAFVLLHLEMSDSRREAIVALLSRNVDKLAPKSESNATDVFTPRQSTAIGDASQLNDDTKFLVDTLKIPQEWIFAARADHAGWRQDRFAQYQLLLRAHHYARAHDIAVSFLAPEGIIRHDHALLLDLFAPFRADSSTDNSHGLRTEMDVPGWSAGGQVFLDYVAMCTSLHHLVVLHAPALASAADGIKAAQKESGDSSLENTLALIEDIVGHEAAAAARRIELMARHIPDLVQRVSDLFDGPAGGRGDPTTMMVARSQMIASLHNCARSMKATRTMAKVATLLPSLAVDLDVKQQASAKDGDADATADDARGTASAAPPVEIESLHFMANAYCDALIAAGGA